MGDRTSTLTAVLVDAVSGPAHKIQAEITGIGESVGRTTALLQGIGQGIGQELFRGLTDAIGAVSRAIPDLLDQGHAYLDLLHQIQLESGMTAEQTSALVGTMRMMGVPTDDLTTVLARLGKNLDENVAKFNKYGIATADAGGTQLGVAQIIDNTRHALEGMADSTQRVAALQEIFGKSGFNLVEFFSATDDEVRKATESLSRWGGIMSEAAIKGADAFGDTLESLRTGVTLIGAQIAAAVDPYLRAFVDSFATFVQSHLQEILNFAVAVVNTITGFASGLFGITNALDVTAAAADETHKKTSLLPDDVLRLGDAIRRGVVAADPFKKTLQDAASGSDAFTKSLQAQIAAIDAHGAALQQAADRRRAIQERQRLGDSLAAAQAQLADLRGNAPFTEGLSSSEAVLARQKHAQDIIDAEKDVADKRQAIGDFELDQRDRAERELAGRQKARLQDLIAGHKSAAAAILADSKAAAAAILDEPIRQLGDTKNAFSGVVSSMALDSKKLGETARASFQAGIDAARGFLDILVGTERELPNGSTVRSGGILGALSNLGDTLSGLGLTVDGVARTIADSIGLLRSLVPPLTSGGANSGGALEFGNQIGLSINQWLQGVFAGVPGHAAGALIPATPGGRVVRVGEGGEDEYIIPRSKMAGGGVTVVINQNSVWPPPAQHARAVRDWIDEALDIVADNAPVGLVGFRVQG